MKFVMPILLLHPHRNIAHFHTKSNFQTHQIQIPDTPRSNYQKPKDQNCSSSMAFRTTGMLSLALIISDFTTALTTNLPRASTTDTWQLNCTSGYPAMMCSSMWGTNCSSAGQILRPAPAYFKNGCNSGVCACALAPPIPCVTDKLGDIVCGFTNAPDSLASTSVPETQTAELSSSKVTDPSGQNANAAATSSVSISTMQSGSFCATVTVTVTHFREHNATHTHHSDQLHHSSTFTGGSRANETATDCEHGNSTSTSGHPSHSMTTLGNQ